jgi:hypothetical protein
MTRRYSDVRTLLMLMRMAESKVGKIRVFLPLRKNTFPYSYSEPKSF